jgi:demethylmenaquinone methyltransferase/2-methoxy-6-polyprenyl-1,4-benzoquinol methylase
MSPCDNDKDIQRLFNSIAARYDLANLFISAGCVTIWYRKLILAILSSQTPRTVLDLCCGTGAITQRLIQHMMDRGLSLPAVDCVDFSQEMLHCAQVRLNRHNIFPRFINADATILSFEDASYDTVVISFGIRNLSKKKEALEESFRVLKPYGKLFILELTPPPSPLVHLFHTLYMKTFVPLIGGLLTSHKGPYRYLDLSIKQFNLPDLLETIQGCGFSRPTPVMLSLGTATIIQAEKK